MSKEEMHDDSEKVGGSLTPYESNLPTTPQTEEDKVLGLTRFRQDMLESGRLVLPYLKLVQSMSDDFTQDSIQPGHFRNSLTGEDLGIEVEICPILILHWRRFFKEREVFCSSNDSLIGYGDPGGECKKCPLSKWHIIRANGIDEELPSTRVARPKKDEELIPPICSEQFVFPSMILNSEWGVPGAVVFHKSYLQEGLRFYSTIDLTPPYTVYKLTASKVSNDKGTWFVPRVNLFRKLTDDEKVQFNKYRSNLRNVTVDVNIEDEQ